MKPIRVVVFIVTLLISLAVLFYTEGKGYYEPGENGSFELEAGDTFIIKLDENPSTGYKKCWLTGMKFVRLKATEFIPNSSADGAGGITTYIFEAITKGSDTLKVAGCPTGPERKQCADYTVKDVEPENVFFVNVR